MLNDELRGSGLLAFSDPAGAKACLALAALIRARDASVALQLFSNKAYDFFAEWDIPVAVVEDIIVDALPTRPNWIVCGTSHPDTSRRFELRVLAQAQHSGIRSYAFVDHWTAMRLRFTNPDGCLVLPDRILVLDEAAREAAVADGLPAELIILCPNPYLTFITTLWKPGRSREAILQSLPDGVSRYILYAPDPISLRNETGAWGFDEVSALHDLAKAMHLVPVDVALLIKAHPLQPMETLRRAAETLSGDHASLFAPAFNNLELAVGAEAVVGFHSNFLLEADALGKHVLRYFPDTPAQDALAHVTLGQKLHSLRDLTTALHKILT